jgi:hypothetical protein
LDQPFQKVEEKKKGGFRLTKKGKKYRNKTKKSKK